MKDYASIATQYARDVVDGQILACKWVRLACARHLRDLERDAAGWRYTWNPELKTADELDEHGNVVHDGKLHRPADRWCHLIELLPHIKGEWAARRERIRLEPWEVFFVASIFGWIDRETNRRRIRVADLFVPRKNSKSTLAAAIGLGMLTIDGEFGAEVYTGATSEGQAREVFDPARLMAEQSPDFRSLFGVLVRASSITIPSKNCKFEPIIGKPGDGASPSCAIIDEYHEHPTEDLYDTMRTGMGARAQALTLVITTAGDDIAGPCYTHQEELQQILEGVIEDEQRFGVIYTLDVDDDGKLEDWTTPEALVKANPNFNVSIDAEFLLTQQRDAIRDPRKQATF
ncbi:MAG TPA: terminase large subunit, partial [Burkholderiales bacterium]